MFELTTKLIVRVKLLYPQEITPIVTGNYHWGRLIPYAIVRQSKMTLSLQAANWTTIKRAVYLLIKNRRLWQAVANFC
jgi:hypothetical protein